MSHHEKIRSDDNPLTFFQGFVGLTLPTPDNDQMTPDRQEVKFKLEKV